MTGRGAYGAPPPNRSRSTESMNGFCSHCGAAITGMLPVEPVFSLTTVADLLPVSVSRLRQLLHDHRERLTEPVYKAGTGNSRKFRMLPASDVRLLRSILLKTRKPRLPADVPAEPVADRSGWAQG